jgi:hypothetical protein
MPVEDSLDLIAARERALGQFAEASPQETLALAGDLAATMRTVVRDDALWSRLAEASARAEGTDQIRRLVLVDWEALLEEWGMPDARIAAMELTEAVTHADADGGWERARELLDRLTELLEGDMRQPQLEKPGWLRRVRTRAAAGFSALRRVRVGALAAEGGMGIGEATAPVLLGVALVPLVGPAAPVVGAAVGGLGIGLARFLRDRVEEELPPELDALFGSRALSAEANGAARADLDLMRALGEKEKWGSAITRLLADLRLWAARIGATLTAASPVIAAHLKSAGLHAVDRVMVALVDFQRSLCRIAEAVRDKDHGSFAAEIDRAREEVGRIGNSLWELEGMVAHR